MTRGKYAARAANTRAAADAEATTASYIRQIRNLTTERDQYKTELTTARREHAKAVRILTVQRDEAISPELIARDHVIKELRDEVAKVKASKEHLQRTYDKLLHYVHDMFVAQGMDRSAAFGAIVDILGDTTGTVLEPVTTPKNGRTRVTAEQGAVLNRTKFTGYHGVI